MKKTLTVLALTASFLISWFLFTGDNIQEYTYNDYISWKIEKKKNAKPSYGSPDKAALWMYQQRAYPFGRIPDNWREEALQHISENNIALNKENGIETLSWSQVGPGNYGGRIRSILVHPSDPNIIYIGAVSGGIWKTTNGGTEWIPLKDNMENLAVCSMVMDPANPNIIYAGTGEGYFNYDAQRGEGIFKSTDAGATWTRLISTKNINFYYVNKLMIDNTTGALYAATRKGLYKSIDGGTTFTASLTGSGSDVHCTDVEIAYTTPTTIFASFGLFNDGQIWRSLDAGLTFAAVFSQSGHGRIEMAVSPSNPLIAYASFNDLSTNGVSLMIKTADRGTNWSTITVPGPSYSGASNYAGTQAWYDNILAVDPGNPNILYAGGIDFWKSTNGGSSWVQKTNWYAQSGAPQYTHADHHAITFAPSNQNLMFLGTDGGIYVSTNKGENWADKNNNLSITQFYYGAIGPSGAKYYGGTQDNGTLMSSSGLNWSEVLGGDGGATEIDFNNGNIIYMEYVNLAIFKSTNGGSSFFSAMNGIPKGPNFYDGTTDRTLFISPFAMDPNNSQTLVAGTYRVYRTTNGASSWTAISGDLTGDGTGQNGASISALCIAKGNSDVIYAATSNGRVQVSTNSGGSWTLRNSGIPAAYITKVVTDPNDPATAFVTLSGFASGQKVYKTANYGQSWTNITGNLPNVPANSIFVSHTDVNNIYVGTDLGLFITTNGGSTWVQDTGVPNVNIMDIDYRASDSRLLLATHGRSMYTAVLTGGTVITNIDLTYDDGTPANGYFWQAANQASANRITPTVTGAKLVKMAIYINSINSGSAKYYPIVLSKNGSQPGSDLVTLPLKTASVVGGWDETDLSSHNLIVNDEFFVGIKYDGVNQPTFGYDAGNNGRAWDNNGGGWSAWNETYFMRATIQTVTTDVEIDTRIPETFEVSQNFPNPFNPSTSVRYALPNAEDVKIIVYDITGKQVAELVNNYQNPGSYTVTWNGRNDDGRMAASGTYILSVRAGNYSQSKKMILLK